MKTIYFLNALTEHKPEQLFFAISLITSDDLKKKFNN